MKGLKKLLLYLPGIFLAFIIAVASKFIADNIPMSLISASVIALFIGMLINTVAKPKEIFYSGIKFTSKRLLKFAIILLGSGLNITMIMHAGSVSLIVMVFTLFTCFGAGHFIGKALRLNWKMSNLISAGTGICGGSAIAAIAPVIEAEDRDIAFAMSATFIFDMVMIIIFPLMGRALGLSDVAYGLWSGTAVNDTSSVVAVSYAFSEAAGDFAVMVKLTRTLAIIPAVITFTLINLKIKNGTGSEVYNGTRSEEVYNGTRSEDVKPAKGKFSNVKAIIPWFILGFLAMSGLCSLGLISAELSAGLKEISKFLMVAALAAIGLNTSLKDMTKSGAVPMLHGFIISALVVIVAIGVIMLEQYFHLI